MVTKRGVSITTYNFCCPKHFATRNNVLATYCFKLKVRNLEICVRNTHRRMAHGYGRNGSSKGCNKANHRVSSEISSCTENVFSVAFLFLLPARTGKQNSRRCFLEENAKQAEIRKNVKQCMCAPVWHIENIHTRMNECGCKSTMVCATRAIK